MRWRVRPDSRSLVLLGAASVGWLLAAELLPVQVQASSPSETDPSSSEWTTTHSDEPSSPPPSQNAKSTSKNGATARSQTSRKRVTDQAQRNGSGATQGSHKDGQTAKAAKPEPFGIQLEKLFRGIGADLEEFFVGTRTVDKDD